MANQINELSKKIISTGAIRKTPKRIIERIVLEVSSYDENSIIIEVGAGQGEITEALLKKNANAIYYAYEIDYDFYIQLKKDFPQLKIYNKDALTFHEDISIDNTIDYFVTTIPLSFYNNAEIIYFYNNINERLKKGGKLIILFTAFWLLPTLKKLMPDAHISSFITIPPYFLIVYVKR